MLRFLRALHKYPYINKYLLFSYYVLHKHIQYYDIFEGKWITTVPWWTKDTKYRIEPKED
jgi:hypothetical protein